MSRMRIGLALIVGIMVIGISGIAQGQDEEAVVTLNSLTLIAGEPGVVEARIDCPDTCAMVTIEIAFDPAMVRVDDVLRGPYFGAGAELVQNSVNNGGGSVLVQIAATTPPPPDAEPVVFFMNVTARADGMTALEIVSLEVLDSWSNAIPSRGESGEIVVGATTPAASSAAQIVFVSERDGNREIYLMNADGSNVARLTDDPAADESPVWSPDGARIAFVSDRGGNPDIMVMNADGADPQQLTADPAADTYPAWSPDGTQIAFVSNRGGNEAIYVMSAAGGDAVALTDAESNNTMPAWSPDGTQIAFVSDRDGNHEIYIMNVDGSAQTRVTMVLGANMWFPAWSPEGSLLAATYEGGGGQIDYFTMLPDGSNPQPVGVPGGWIGRLAWSPDGAQMVFAGLTGEDTNLFVAAAADPQPGQLTDLPTGDFAPDWRPGAAVAGETPDAPTGPAADVACAIWAEGPDVAVRVGAGAERGVFDFLTPGERVDVIGQNSDSGALWWLIDKSTLTDDPGVNTLWVAAAEVSSEGDCARVAQVDNSGVVPAQVNNTGASGEEVPLGQWGACGSCNTCGGQANECQINPQGECVWNPQVCGFDMPAAPPSAPSESGSSGPVDLPPPIASFTWYVSGACNEITVVNTSRNVNASSVWRFGDSGTAYYYDPVPGQSGTHTYSYETHSYFVSLVVFNTEEESDSVQQIVEITCP